MHLWSKEATAILQPIGRRRKAVEKMVVEEVNEKTCIRTHSTIGTEETAREPNTRISGADAAIVVHPYYTNQWKKACISIIRKSANQPNWQ